MKEIEERKYFEFTLWRWRKQINFAKNIRIIRDMNNDLFEHACEVASHSSTGLPLAQKASSNWKLLVLFGKLICALESYSWSYQQKTCRYLSDSSLRTSVAFKNKHVNFSSNSVSEHYHCLPWGQSIIWASFTEY